MSFLKDFREFAMRGNVIDLAVGVVIGTAFGAITSSLVADVIMPPLGMLIGGTDFSNYKVVLKEAIDKAPAVTLNYGLFLQHLFDFMIVALAMFIVIKLVNKMLRKRAGEPPAAPSRTEVLLEDIRDALRQRQD